MAGLARHLARVAEASRLEAANVITNPQAFADDPGFAASSGIRMGTQEMTRYGMKEADFETLAGLLAQIVHDDDTKAKDHWREEVTTFRSGFREMGYCF